MKLTKRKREVMNAIRELYGKLSYPPTVRELSKSVGISCSTMHKHGFKPFCAAGTAAGVPAV
ncbi:LexA family protein [Brevibacillus fluminis]|uniref:LexA family protein n=1 Tax=Brevibacillus fluminis TaxID=511487 RepID=UPI003F8B4423